MAWKFFVENKSWADICNLRIIRGNWNGNEVVQPFVFKRYDKGLLIPDDEIAISGTRIMEEDNIGGAKSFLQAAMDCAWEEGMRPKALEDQRQELKAVRDHLQDMRTLALPRDIQK